MDKTDIPTFDAFMNPLIEALQELGGSGTIEEINTRVIEKANLSDEQVEVLHNPDKGGGQTEVEYRVAWTRTYLKKYGLLDNSSRGVWALTADGMKVKRVDPRKVRRAVQQRATAAKDESEAFEVDEAQGWREELLEALQEMDPSAFERLVQRLLRESGFVKVEVTGRSGDGGIDGKGVIRLGGLLSFHVIFQCKRYRGSVSASQVRDFRGAMVGRADKGLLITTGSFTQGAVTEAVRDGAPPIDLIDGEELLEKLKALGLGVRTEIVETERVTVDRGWFEGI